MGAPRASMSGDFCRGEADTGEAFGDGLIGST